METDNPNGMMNYFKELMKPNPMHPDDSESILIRHKKNFEYICNMMQQHTPKDVERLTVFKFFALQDSIRLINKNKTKED